MSAGELVRIDARDYRIGGRGRIAPNRDDRRDRF